MYYTSKQERNGATGGSAASNPAVPGPDATAVIAAAMASSMSSDMNASGVVGPTAGVVDWETGIAGHEMPGEA